MAPRLKRTDKAPRTKPAEEKAPVAMMSPQEAEFRQKLRELRAPLRELAGQLSERLGYRPG